MRRLISTVALLTLALASRAADHAAWQPAPEFAEQTRWATLADGAVRLFVSSPARPDPQKPTRLIVYATPNGNTIEQTLGRAKADGVDWHYDIQHVAAQVRRLREIDDRENLVLAVAQAKALSWPAFRKDNPTAGATIRAVVDEAARDLPGSATRIVLTGHSGGGSFIFGYLNAVDALPASVDRIAFLDANYSFDEAAGHGDKLLTWLKADAARHLVVIAYDDREITLDGKKVVGPTGGTFRATQRMLDFFKKSMPVTQTLEGPFTHSTALAGQIECFVHANPENKILHTALVGEMNGLLHALALHTLDETRWGTFGGPRAYERFVSAQPTTAPATQPTPRPDLKLPARPHDAITGSAFFGRVKDLSPADRELAIREQILSGNVPNFLRALAPVHVEAAGADGKKHASTFFVTPDYLAVGADDDFFRVPMTPMTARACATALDASLITRKMSDDIFRAAALTLAPQPLTEARESTATFFQHHQLIEAQRAASGKPAGAFVAGIKKDVVISNRLFEQPHRVAIYGWHLPGGKPIQPLTIVHRDTYVDYSHGVRLVSRRVRVDDRWDDLANALGDADRCALLSDEGPIARDPYASLGRENP